MKKYIIIIVNALLLFLAYPAYAITLSQLQQQFSQYPVVRADFVQHRYIQGLSKPLISSGKMIVSEELGLLWQQQLPFVMTLKMNDQRMEQTIFGQKTQTITAESQPQLFQFNYLLTAIFKAEQDILEHNFDITLSEQGNIWQLTLIPKLSPLNKIFMKIELSGATYLSQIILYDQQHDKNDILFSNHQTQPLNTNERHDFN